MCIIDRPSGASLEVDNEIKGMNKLRIQKALEREGIETVRFYNPDGVLGYRPDDSYFADKQVDIARLKNWSLAVSYTHLNSVEIVNDIRTVCLSKNKMTEKERMEIVFGIRPKLKAMNKKLQRLTKAVKYTSMGDIWLEIDEGARPTKANKPEIVNGARRRWRQAGKNVMP